MSGILKLESLTKGNTLKQGDKTPLKYRLFDADGEKLNIAGKSATVRLVYPDFLTIGYEKGGLIVAQDDTVTFTIDNVIPPSMYHVEVIVDDTFIFPSRADEAKFTVDKSSFGTEADIIEIVGVDAVVRKVVDIINKDGIPGGGNGSYDDTEVKAHMVSTDNPHNVTKGQVGLDNVDNTSDADKPVSTAMQSALNNKADKAQVLTNVPASAKFTDTIYSHPSTHPASMIVETSTKRFTTDAEKANWNSKTDDSSVDSHVAKTDNPHNVTKAQVGLSNVNNTDDLSKPVSTDTQDALDLKADKSQVLTNVPSNAKFTDTVYDDTALKKRVSDLEEAPSNGMSIVVLESYEEYEALTPDTNTIYLIKGDTEIEPGIEVKRESRTIAIPFDTKSEDNATLNVGQTAVKQVGKDGVRTILEDVTYTDGVETSRVHVSSSITTQPVDEIIWIGTKPIADNATFENNFASEITPITNGYQLELTSASGGLIISGIAITTAGRYKLEFNIKKLSGNFKSLGGHVDGNYTVGNAVYYDGENVGNSWADGFVIPTDDENTHSVKVEFDVSSGINTVDTIYISPNRQQTTWADAHGLFEVTNISMKRV